MPEININVVMGQIIMTVKAIDWTEGNVGHVGVCLNGGSCRIDWGNGRTGAGFIYRREWINLSNT